MSNTAFRKRRQRAATLRGRLVTLEVDRCHAYHRDMFALDDTDDIGFVHQVQPIAAGVLRAAEPRELYVIKVDSWFGDKWLGFSAKLVGRLGLQHRKTLRVPPFVPARVRAQDFFVRDASGAYVSKRAPQELHVEQTSEDNMRRLMSIVCPEAAVLWWSGETRRNRRGSLMAYLPTDEGHAGWYAEFRRGDAWTVAKTCCTSAHELAMYAESDRVMTSC
jgi:hypothetical protein